MRRGTFRGTHLRELSTAALCRLMARWSASDAPDTAAREPIVNALAYEIERRRTALPETTRKPPSRRTRRRAKSENAAR